MATDQFYLSRDQIRNQIIDLTKEYLELENVDLTKSSFLTFVIETLSTLSGNLTFYESNVYKEFFLTQAQLPDSVYNLSTFLGYTPSEAQYSTANLLITIPYGDMIETLNNPIIMGTQEEPFKFTSTDGIIFLTFYDVQIEILGNPGQSVNIILNQDGKIYNIKTENIGTLGTDLAFQFVLPVRQYENVEHEFSIEDLLEAYRFYSITVPVQNKISTIEVYVTEPGGAEEEYNLVDSLYLLDPDDKGFVMRKSTDGRTITFGNGVIGYQPRGGSSVRVVVQETQGLDGNVITSSIVKGDRLYITVGGINEAVNYTVVNPSPAINGSDEESVQEIRSGAIAGLTSLNRLVSEQDFKNSGLIIPESPLASNSIPVLKRSDIKVNEIQLFTTLNYANDIVPTRNVTYDMTTSDLETPRNTIISDGGNEYYTIFDMTFDEVNSEVYYTYAIEELELVPTLESTPDVAIQDVYNFNINGFTITKTGTTVSIVLDYFALGANPDTATCDLLIEQGDGTEYPADVNNNSGTTGTFEWSFDYLNPLDPNYLDFPLDLIKIKFIVQNTAEVSVAIFNSEYSVSFIFRQDLRSYMISNAVINGTDVTVYDIPVIDKVYFDNPELDKSSFELEVLQQFLSSVDMRSYRMITDFVNVKMCDTIGTMDNMLLNETTIDLIRDVGLATVPTDAWVGTVNTDVLAVGDRFVVTGYEGGDWSGQQNKIAKCITITPTVTWEFITPVTNSIATIEEKENNYIFTQSGWVVPQYEIPLKIELEVFKSTTGGRVQDTDLVSTVKTAIYDAFQNRFGPNVTLHRSEIIDVVQSISGVAFCRLIEPASSIFFNFNIDDFNQDELLVYTPEWIHFSEDDITVRIYTE